MYFHCVCFSLKESIHQSKAAQHLLEETGKTFQVLEWTLLDHHNSLTAGGRGMNINKPVCFLDPSLTGSRGAQKFFPALSRTAGSKSKQFPCNSALSQLGWRERALTGSSNGPKLKEKMTATPPTRNVTSVTLSVSVCLVCDTMTAFSQPLTEHLPDGFLQFYDQEDLIQDEYDWDVNFSRLEFSQFLRNVHLRQRTNTTTNTNTHPLAWWEWHSESTVQDSMLCGWALLGSQSFRFNHIKYMHIVWMHIVYTVCVCLMSCVI